MEEKGGDRLAATIYSSLDRTIRGVIFDMDGVVLDTEKLYARFWQEACIALGYPMTRQQALGMRSLNRQAGQAQLESYFGPGISREEVRRKRIELMDAYIEIHGVDPMPGIRETLMALKERGLATAIATSSPEERAKQYLHQLDLLELFDVICSGDHVTHGKPAPDIYLLAAEKIGLPTEVCLAVEDSPAGILSAHGAGCLPVFIPDQDEADEKTGALLFARIDRLTDIMDILKEKQP